MNFGNGGQTIKKYCGANQLTTVCNYIEKAKEKPENQTTAKIFLVISSYRFV